MLHQKHFWKFQVKTLIKQAIDKVRKNVYNSHPDYYHKFLISLFN